MKDKVVAIQYRDGLTDGRMAALLGISRPTWCNIRNGRARFTHNVAIRAAGAFPELTRDLLEMAEAAIP